MGLNKTSGWFQAGINEGVINSTYNINDMGINNERNFINAGGNIDFFQFKPYRSILNSHLGLNVNGNKNLTTKRTNNLGISLNGNLTFKSFNNIYLGCSYNPVEEVDNYEARVPGRVFIRPTNKTAWAGFDSDTSKNIFNRLNKSQSKNDIIIFIKVYKSSITIILRI